MVVPPPLHGSDRLAYCVDCIDWTIPERFDGEFE